MKKILLTTVFAMAAFTAVADDAAVATTGDALTGVLLGVEGALQRTDFSQNLVTRSIGNATTQKMKKPSYQWAGAGSLGYFTSKDDLYYGAKLSIGKTFGTRSKKKTTETSGVYNNVVTKTSQQYNVALTGQLGTYVTKDTVVYGLLGVKRIRYDFDVSGYNINTANTVSGNVGKTVWGPVVGFGMKKSLSDSWSFNTEISYEMYKKIKTGNVDSAAARNIGVTIRPQVWNLAVGFSNKF
jgi:opacity protein-like surface antigen